MKQTITNDTANLQANLVIIGSGGAGFAAAVSAAEKGVKDIVILEKRGNIGGNTARAHGLFACESPAQKRLGITANRDEYFKKALRWAHWSRVNPRIIRAYLNKSGDTIRWFEEKGVDFELPSSEPGGLPSLGVGVWHLPAKGPEGRHGARLIKVLEKQFKEMGGRLLPSTTVKKILRNKKGKVIGVTASSANGKELQIDTGCVIIATGGFAANKGLLRKYCPEYREQIQVDKNAIPNMGDGLALAEEAGAAIAEAVSILKNGPHTYYGGKGRFLPPSVISTHTLWVNKRGRRFIDEGAAYNDFESVNAVLEQPDCVMYSLLDHNTMKNNMKSSFLPPPEETKNKSQGERFPLAIQNEEELREMAAEKDAVIKIADSWEEIAAWIGADPGVLKATVKSYNAFCKKGYDEEFAKDKRLLIPVTKAPYYAVKGDPGVIDTMGGIKTSEYMEVLDKQDNPIPGYLPRELPSTVSKGIPMTASLPAAPLASR